MIEMSKHFMEKVGMHEQTDLRATERRGEENRLSKGKRQERKEKSALSRLGENARDLETQEAKSCGGSAVQLYGWTAVNSASHLGIHQVSGQYRELGGAIHSGAAYVLEQASSHIGNSTQAAVRDAVVGRPSLD
ncbi:hypothetical protein J1605_005036 [Eschrichtius robustus]|uniref:Uncharacterized protein n=1 Tax=Eschrichtius robustus TaxID=9764 RepID=A0AB34HCS3_ESCRO|nr:hypothetical protein J1605_005036 [Eschrichtius robustus]